MRPKMAARNRNEHISVSYYSIFMILVPNYGKLRTLSPCLRCMIRFNLNFTFSRSRSRLFLNKKTFRVQYFYYKCVKFEFLFFRQKFMSGGHTNWPLPWASLYDIYNYNIESYNFVANCFVFWLILGKNLLY